MKGNEHRYALALGLALIVFAPILIPLIVPDMNSAASFLSPVFKQGSITATATTQVASSIPLSTEIRVNSSQFQFINPLLFTETDKRQYTELNPLVNLVNYYIRTAVNNHNADSISVYVRNMDNGHWTGVNEDRQYEPSSMLKVAVLMAYLRSASRQAILTNTTVDDQLSKTLVYPGADTTGQNYPPTDNIPSGPVPVSQLLSAMITYSDNVALDVLMSNKAAGFQRVYKDLRFPVTTDNGTSDFMTARSYAVIFRTLYNSTYLPWELSERALSLLASTTFNNGLVAGVPAGTVVAHKFGEHTNLGPSGNPLWHELHDCGIVYYPGKPYLLCVMTSGQDFSKLESVISGISALTYQFMGGLPAASPN